ncbi:purine-cytosine permease family protein [Kribbella deserti]|uniref:Purine-cytosine permease family protein n=1 Tax=Kribbella deserti TaxID=1926257 RepID=A0ABV6QHX9_9ACTN
MSDPRHASRTDRRVFAVETTGIDVVRGSHRRGRARELFWPWFGANVSILGLSYGAFALGFGISFWQAAVAGLFGIVFSFFLCGLIALAGKRGSAPTMVLSRAPFGVRGNRIPAALSWILTVGWETFLTVTATLATATVFRELGWGGGTVTKAVALAVVGTLIVVAGVIGFNLIIWLQTGITIITGVLTVVYVLLVADQVDWATVAAMPNGSTQQVIGALIFLMTGFGLGWVNLAADYSRYLPRETSNRGVIGWTTFGAAAAPIVLFTFGLLLAGSSPDLSTAIANDPIGALAAALPTWFLLPFATVAVLGLVGGAVLDIYSSGLALLAAGVRVRRHIAALIDGIIMVIGTIAIVFVGSNFLSQFTGFLITLGVPIAAWCGIMLADMLSRKRDYADEELFTPRGRYGNIQWLPIIILGLCTVLGWGLVTNTTAGWLDWQGYLLWIGLGGREGDWAYANVGVLVALVLSFVLQYALGRSRVRQQESIDHQPVYTH